MVTRGASLPSRSGFSGDTPGVSQRSRRFYRLKAAHGSTCRRPWDGRFASMESVTQPFRGRSLDDGKTRAVLARDGVTIETRVEQVRYRGRRATWGTNAT